MIQRVAEALAGIAGTIALAGCATDPRQLCASLVPPAWQYVGDDKNLDELLKHDLPRVPYSTNKGKVVRVVRHVWFHDRPNQLLACTLSRHARDACSLRTTTFIRRNESWSKAADDAYLCNVVVSSHGRD